jgi:hypothetical protein
LLRAAAAFTVLALVLSPILEAPIVLGTLGGGSGLLAYARGDDRGAKACVWAVVAMLVGVAIGLVWRVYVRGG